MFDGPWETCMLVRGLNVSECASWVQAIAATVAVAAGAYGLYWQAGQQRRTVRDQEVGKLMVLASGLFFCIAFTKEAIRDGEAGQPYVDALGRLRSQIDLLASVPPLEIPDWSVAVAVARAVHAFRQAAEHTQRAAKTEWPDTAAANFRSDVPWLNMALEYFEAGESTVGQALVERGAAVPKLTYRINDVLIHSFGNHLLTSND